MHSCPAEFLDPLDGNSDTNETIRMCRERFSLMLYIISSLSLMLIFQNYDDKW